MTIEDNWADDDISESQGVEVRNVFKESNELPKFLTDLRDGLVGPSPEAGMARARRLEKMQKDVVALSEFVNDLDRYFEHSKTAQLVGGEVGPYMAKFIRDTRNQAIRTGRTIYEQMNYLRSHG